MRLTITMRGYTFDMELGRTADPDYEAEEQAVVSGDTITVDTPEPDTILGFKPPGMDWDL